MKKLLIFSLVTLSLTSCQDEVLSFLSQPVGENLQEISINLSEILPERYQESIGVLDLSNLSLESIPDLSQYFSEEQLAKITEIDLSGNNLAELSASAFDSLKNLSLIDAASNQIDTIDLSSLTGLTQLNLSDNDLIELPEDTLPSVLEKLDVSNNNLKDLAGIVGTQIQLLHASGNNLKNKAIEALDGISSIRSIDLSDNDFTGTIKERIEAFTQSFESETEETTGNTEE